MRIGVGVYPFELDATDLFPYLRFSALDTLLGISLERGRLMGSVFAGGSLIVGQAPGQLDLLTAYSADTTIGWRLDSRFEIRTRVTGTYASGSAQSTGNHAGQFRFPHLFVVGSLGLATEF